MGKLNYTAAEVDALLAKADAMEAGGGSASVSVKDTGLKFGYSTFTEVPSWADFTGVTDMSNMFYYCRALTTVPALDTSNVTNMNNMFYYCRALTTVPTLDTSNVTNMSYMFQGCSSLTTVPTLDTSKVTNMSYMFYSCSSLTTVPTLDTSNVTNMSSMFSSCSRLATMNIANLGAQSSVTATIDFSPCPWVNGLYDSLYTNSFDRAAAGYASRTIKLSTTSKNALTDAQKAAITAKGYTIS